MAAGEVKRLEVTLPGFEGQWVEIKARRGWAGAKRVEGAAIALRADPDAAEENAYVAGMDPLKRGLALLESSIIAWSLELPPTAAGFLSEAFDEDLGDWLVEALDAYYASVTRSGEDRKI